MSSMSQSSLPVFEIGLKALSAVLDKAEAFATAKKIDQSVLLAWRLAPDMFALARQVQIVADQAKNGAARLAGVEPPRFEDTETTIEQLKARLEKTIAFVRTVDPTKIDGSVDRGHALCRELTLMGDLAQRFATSFGASRNHPADHVAQNNPQRRSSCSLRRIPAAAPASVPASCWP